MGHPYSRPQPAEERPRASPRHSGCATDGKPNLQNEPTSEGDHTGSAEAVIFLPQHPFLCNFFFQSKMRINILLTLTCGHSDKRKYDTSENIHPLDTDTVF